MTTRSARRRETLDEETILDATATILRRHGPAKATVLDVARELGVSHGSVYRFFPSKAALREQVTRRWLTAAHGVLAGIAGQTDVAPPARLESWLGTLYSTTRGQVADDPELFATFLVLVREQSGVVDAHVAELRRQIAGILADGAADGSLAPDPDVTGAAAAVLNAVTRFHHPAHAAAWERDGAQADFGALRALVLDALRPTRGDG